MYKEMQPFHFTTQKPGKPGFYHILYSV